MMPRAKLCKHCHQPMLPKGKVKKPDEYDHASGCPMEPKDKRGQLDLLMATAARDKALEDVASTAGTGTWINAVLALIRAMPTGRRFTTDHLWLALGEQQPTELRAMGAAMMAARKESLALPNGHYVKSTRVVNHARPLAEWVRI